MKISESWLREWVDPALTTQALADQITMAGLEVDAIETIGDGLSGVVVGEIVAIEQHPDADKLRVCQVAGGHEQTTQVVCGAPNARVGIKIPFATVGAVLPDNFKIKKAKLRGVESFGMLCGQTELKLGDDDEGLWELANDAPVGEDLRTYLALDDTCIDVDLTPNRSDCLSIKGIAREVGVLNRMAVTAPTINAIEPQIDDTVSVDINAGTLCPRYGCRVIRNVDISQPTPLWMQEKLRRAGLNSKDIIVDVTNYVLLELGQPMHAFDLDKLNTGIVVRTANEQEKITLLNGQEATLTTDTLVIADHTSAQAIAGIMGGSDSAVSATTQHILLESAFFTPIAIAGRARSYGLHTDSSHRFERGVDYELQAQALERATALIIEVAGGQPGPVSMAQTQHSLLETRTIELRRLRIQTGLGFSMDDAEVLDILQRLGLEKTADTEQGWRFNVPSYRFDLNIEADLLEELARVYGYNQLPTTTIQMEVALAENHESQLNISALRDQLIARGYQEAISYSFVDPTLQEQLNPDQAGIALKNPISADMAIMRTNLWPGLIQALQHNVNRQQNRVRLFETGLRFVTDSIDSAPENINQQPVIAGLIYGNRYPEGWSSDNTVVDFYDLKGDIEALLALTAQAEAFSVTSGKHPALHPGQTAELSINGQVIGIFGALHPQLQKQLDLAQPVYLFEIQQQPLLNTCLPKYNVLSKHPEVRRDLAIIVDQTVPVAHLEDKVLSIAGNNLVKLKVFDVYVGEGIDPHRKSVALGLTFQHPSRTLNDDEITVSLEAVRESLEKTFNATLR